MTFKQRLGIIELLIFAEIGDRDQRDLRDTKSYGIPGIKLGFAATTRIALDDVPSTIPDQFKLILLLRSTIR
jgi:hypothetical protein